MKKGISANTTKNESLEVTKRLYRSASDCIRRLDEQCRQARCVEGLFQPELQNLRTRLKDCCLRLMIIDPVNSGKKAEELLWRKIYYDTTNFSKQFKKDSRWTDVENHLVQSHLLAGLGTYQHLLVKFQQEYCLNIDATVDFYSIKPLPARVAPKPAVDPNVEKWARDAVHRCLVSLGDLTRYLQDIDPRCTTDLPERYYMQALTLNPLSGIPHNKLGSMADNNHCGLEGVYHYIRCLTSSERFDGAEANLRRVFEKTRHRFETIEFQVAHTGEQPHDVKHLLRGFIVLADIFFYDRQNSVHDPGQLCQQVLTDLHHCEGSGNEDEELLWLKEDGMIKMVVIMLDCIYQLQENKSSHLNSSIVFTLALLSHFVDQAIQQFENKDVSLGSIVPDPTKETKTDSLVKVQDVTNTDDKVTKKNRRNKANRRRRRHNSREESDQSADEASQSDSEDSAATSGNESEDDEEVSSESEEEQEDSSKQTTEEAPNEIISEVPLVNGNHDENQNERKVDHKRRKHQQLDPGTLISIMATDTYIPCIRICCDWLKSSLDTLKTYAQGSHLLWSHVVILLNLINVDINSIPDNIIEEKFRQHYDLSPNCEKVPLPEDVACRGVALLAPEHKQIDWSSQMTLELTPEEEAVIRLQKIVSFAHHLTTVPECGLRYNRYKKVFYIKKKMDQKNRRFNHKLQEPRKRELMKNMAQLRLKAEVHDLESHVKQHGPEFTPYLVCDATAFADYRHCIMQLTGSKKFVVIVPTVVISTLDEWKKESAGAREAIRWLELQFHRGNRFMRAQRSKEQLPLRMVKYPKKKDKEGWIFFQIMECCCYLSQQVSMNDASTALVTLLTGEPPNVKKDRSYSPSGVAKAANVNYEFVEAFHSKWKNSTKSHG